MPYKVIIKVGAHNARGTEYSVRHIMTPEIFRMGGNECGVPDRVACTYTNLLLPVDRQNSRSVSTQLKAASRKARSKSSVRSIILSFEDTKDSSAREEQVALSRPLVDAFVKSFAPGAAFWSATHVDRGHVHTHLLLANWSPLLGHALNWSRRDIVHMLSMRWCQRHPPLCHAILPGAWTKAEKTSMAYPRSQACLQLVAAIQANPHVELRKLESEAKATRYKTKSGHPGVIFLGQRITLKNLNFELRKIGARDGIGPDYESTEFFCRPTSLISQQTKIDTALGFHGLSLAEYDRLCDLPNPELLQVDAASQYALSIFQSTGRIIDHHHACTLRRLARTALLRRLKGASKPIGPDCFASWAYGDCRKWSPAMSTLVSEIAEEMGELGIALLKLIEAIIALVSGPIIDR